MQIPDISQIPGTVLPLLPGDGMLVVRYGKIVLVTVGDLATPVNGALGATKAGMALLTAADLDAQKTILGIGA